ncbi:MAG: phage major capsid protein [Candidatus Thiodiazotropha lotti]|nr:phage major capsid protein [Candidatus Thiodiazotropha lotti]
MSDLSEVKALIEDQGRAWEEFKESNDTRIKAIEEKGYAPADVVEKVDKLNAAISTQSDEIGELMKKANRPGMVDSKDGLTIEQREHKEALAAYMREGVDNNLHDLETKALSSGSDPDGGYLIDAEMDREIDRIASTISSMRQIANVRTIGSATYEKLTKTRGVSGGWLEEAGTSTESTEPQWSKVEIPAYKMYAEPWVPNEMLEDSFYDLEGDLTDEAGITFAETEGAGFITGSGVGQPRGIASYTTVANSSYVWGSVGYIASGKAGAFTSSAPADELIDLQHALKPQYRPGASWLMNDSTLGTARQMKDGSGSYYLWNPDPSAGPSGTFLGSPVVIDDNLADISADSLSIAYGNFQRGYTIVDRRGVALIRDPFTKKGVTKFYFSRRVGGGITNFEALKLMKFATG